MKNYEYILIDLDDTIFDFKKGEKVSLSNVLKMHNYDICENEILEFSKLNERYFQMYASGAISRDEFHSKRFKEFLDSLNLNLDAGIVDKEYMDELSNSAEFVDGAYEFILKLKADNYRLFIASNGMHEIQQNRLKKAGIFDYFEKIFVSSKIGFNKPKKEFFDYIFNSLSDFEKSKYIMIGDRIDSDIIGANNAGIDSIFFNRKNENIKVNTTCEASSFDEIYDKLVNLKNM